MLLWLNLKRLPSIPRINGFNRQFRMLQRRVRILSLSIGSVTRLGNGLLFGQVFKAGGINYFTQIDHIVRQFL